MGVPGLFSFFRKRTPASIKTISIDTKLQFDYVFIDGNAYIYPGVHRIFGDKQYNDLPYEKKEEMCFSEILKDIMILLSITNPTKLLYIAIDGSAPQAKQHQQRIRRYLSSPLNDFDINSISPGTLFMYNLHLFFIYSIIKIMDTNYKDIFVEYSSYMVPGEAEHKIMDYISYMQSQELYNCSICVCGPDADLILLSMVIDSDNMYILRGEHDDESIFNVIEIKSIKQYVVELFQPNKNIKDKIFIENIISDFIFITTLLGNDFLPRMKMFLYLPDSIDVLVDITKVTLRKSKYKTLSFNKEEFNHDMLQYFFQNLSNMEIYSIYLQSYRKITDVKFRDDTLNKYIKKNPQGKTYLDFYNYRKEYYKKINTKNDTRRSFYSA